MFIAQSIKLKKSNEVVTSYGSRELSYANFKILNNRIKKLWLSFIHTLFIIISKLWARLTHHVSAVFNKGVKKIDEQLLKHEKKTRTSLNANQSLFITTVKSYKNEVRKLKKRVEDELPRPRPKKKENLVIDKESDITTID